ncbi:MAG: hypothetical protein V1735_07950 [Nanoarchaeota archaeon]
MAAFSLAEWASQAQPLAVIVVGIAVYTTFIYRFYRFVAARDLFAWKIDGKHSAFGQFLFYVFKYLFIYPVFVFFWFSVMALLLIFLSKNYNIDQVLVFSVAIVGACRLVAYYDEEAAREVAKLIPLTMMAVFLVDGAYFDWDRSMGNLLMLPGFLTQILYYLLFIIVLEFVLRIGHGVVQNIKGDRKKA